MKFFHLHHHEADSSTHQPSFFESKAVGAYLTVGLIIKVLLVIGLLWGIGMGLRERLHPTPSTQTSTSDSTREIHPN